MKIIFNQKGQSLLELLIALFILVSVSTATLVLIVTSIRAGRESLNKLTAISLAREGIEIVRNIRDSNWIDDNNPLWDDGLFDPAGPPYNYTAIPIIDGSSPFSLDFTQNDFTIIKLVSNQYRQGAAAGADTRFYRLLYLNPICHDDNEDEMIVAKEDTDNCGAGSYSAHPVKVGVRVISEVRWPTADSNQKMIIEDRLYDWQVL